VGLPKQMFHKFVPRLWTREARSGDAPTGYRRLWKYTVISTALVAIAPLVILTVVNYRQYLKALSEEARHPISQIVSNTRRSLGDFLEERRSALWFVINMYSGAYLSDRGNLTNILTNMKSAFGGFIDLGLIDENGHQLAYAGPYALKGYDYGDQDWFRHIQVRDEYVSDVFLGHRRQPHFVIAVKRATAQGGFYILRAAVDTEMLDRQVLSLHLAPFTDSMLVNRKGVLQTPSRFHGNVLDKSPIAVPPLSSHTEVIETSTDAGRELLVGYAYIERSPFVFMLVQHRDRVMSGWWQLRKELVGFLIGSVILILIVILYGATYMVENLREANLRRAQLLHNVEYTNKLASIGRLASGVAHEINNPLAIINEKAGLMRDIVEFQDKSKNKDKYLSIIESIIRSVDRCKTITHRLLGFARHVDVQTTLIEVDELLEEVVGFLEKEASYRNLTLKFNVGEGIPAIRSDRGQLQQVFLNILNNAFAAVDEGGGIEIAISAKGPDRVQVSISDNGVGIAKEDLGHIFEPFFTKNKELGTGLGLSITYGIVRKLGGNIEVESERGVGTCFRVVLPVEHPVQEVSA